MTHVTCRLTAKNQDQLRNHRSVIEYGLPLLFSRKSEFSCCTVVKLTQNQALGVYALSVHSSSFYSQISRAYTAIAFTVDRSVGSTEREQQRPRGWLMSHCGCLQATLSCWCLVTSCTKSCSSHQKYNIRSHII